MQADLADAEATQAAIDAAAEKPGGRTLLAHAAGAMGQWASVAEMSPADWQRYISVDLNGCFHPLHAAIPHLRRQGGAILAFMGDGWATCKLPERLVVMEELPFTATGKIQRHKLAQSILARDQQETQQ